MERVYKSACSEDEDDDKLKIQDQILQSNQKQQSQLKQESLNQRKSEVMNQQEKQVKRNSEFENNYEEASIQNSINNRLLLNEEEKKQQKDILFQKDSVLDNSDLKISLLKGNKNLTLKDTNYKWLFVFFCATLTTGVYFSYNIPSVLRKQIKSLFELNNTQYNLIFSYPQFLNIILAFVNGIIFDNIGYRLGGIIVTFASLLANILFLFGSIWVNYGCFLTGIFINTVCVEAASIVSNSLTGKWFKGTYIAIAFAFLMVNLRVSGIAASLSSSPLYQAAGDKLWLPILVGLIIAGYSFLIPSFSIFFMDKKQDLQEKFFQDQQNNVNKIKVKVDLRDIKFLTLPFWLLNLSCVIGYMCYYPFTFILADILSDRFSLGPDQVGQVMSIPNFFALVAPLAGVIMDKFGQRPILLIFCYFLNISAYIIWISLSPCLTPCQFKTSIPISIQGVFLGFFSSIIFSSIPLVTKTQYLGTAYGLVSSTKALGLAIGPIILGSLQDNYGYESIFIFMLSFSCLGLAIAITLLFVDKTRNQILEKTTKQNKIQYEFVEDNIDKKKSNLFTDI